MLLDLNTHIRGALIAVGEFHRYVRTEPVVADGFRRKVSGNSLIVINP
ncbi:uncharacterized protein HHUB_2266 [Halobacterium hubeiense]|uniref:Uncharacterized protein n=1 Tax=Halobacterium hubeiense TaxID=1407499 RepID=A0A0U5HTR7_9EURY|nr:uncharacterized protein HHUB_2266 [Halobacterium hubeiense]